MIAASLFNLSRALFTIPCINDEANSQLPMEIKSCGSDNCCSRRDTLLAASLVLACFNWSIPIRVLFVSMAPLQTLLGLLAFRYGNRRSNVRKISFRSDSTMDSSTVRPTIGFPVSISGT